jgi:hypothetical protein
MSPPPQKVWDRSLLSRYTEEMTDPLKHWDISVFDDGGVLDWIRTAYWTWYPVATPTDSVKNSSHIGWKYNG